MMSEFSSIWKTSLANKINGSRFLIREPGVRNEELLEQHLYNNKPTVLISPSMSHGVDLKDDLARIQIIVKAPYLPTKDKRIDRLMNDDFDWYSNKMLCSLIQSCGRGVRSKKDYCTTYILDGAIVESVVKNMFDTLVASGNGIGLAAPQVGINKRIVVIDLKEDGKSNPMTLVNPKILSSSPERLINEEGCLSIPGYYADVKRPSEIEV